MGQSPKLGCLAHRTMTVMDSSFTSTAASERKAGPTARARFCPSSTNWLAFQWKPAIPHLSPAIPWLLRRTALVSGSTFYCLRLLSLPGGISAGANSIEEELYENDKVRCLHRRRVDTQHSRIHRVPVPSTNESTC